MEIKKLREKERVGVWQKGMTHVSSFARAPNVQHPQAVQAIEGE